MSYFLAIIGGGPAGYTAAEKASKAGMDVVLFEQNALGGTCLNVGCIPTKSLLYGAKQYYNATHAQKYGVTAENVVFDFGAMQKRKTIVVRKLVAGIKQRLNNEHCTVVNGFAKVVSRQDAVVSIECNGETYKAANLLICTGSTNFVPPIPGIKDNPAVWDSTDALNATELPKSIIIVGGGVIGMEFAAFFSTLGTKVTVVEMLPKILGPLDDEISEMLQKQYEKRGVQFCLRCKVTGIEGNTVVYEDPEGNVCRVSGDKILVSVGRRANIKDFGLENIGVELALNPAGRPCGIKVDDRMRTNIPGVYAAGDVTGFSMLAHTASREGEVAVNNILGKEDHMRYNAIPGVVYTNPEVAGAGLTEAEAKAKGIDFKVVKLPMAYSGRFVAENERGEGICKIIVGATHHEVLGVHMLGNPCSEIIHSACLAIEAEMTLEQLQQVVFPHPTVSEIIKETAFTI